MNSKLITIKTVVNNSSSLTMQVEKADIFRSIRKEIDDRLDAWIDSDIAYDPIESYKITKLELKNGELKYLELTEGEESH